MVLDIKPLRDINRNCYEDLIASVLNWLGEDFEPIFCNTWGFHFKNNSESIGAGLDPNINEIETVVRKYTGINIKWLDYVKNESKKMIADYIVNGMPVFIRTDRYYCQWSDMYKDKHSQHYCLAIGVDDKNALMCMDPFYNTDCSNLDNLDLEEGCDQFAIIEIQNNNIRQADWKKMINEVVSRIDDNDSFVDMQSFAIQVSKIHDFDKEHKFTNEPWLYPLFIKLRLIANGRKLAAKTLKYIYEKFKIYSLNTLSAELYECGNEWSIIHSILIKNCFSKKMDLNGINVCKQKIMKLAAEEEKLMYELKQLIATGINEQNKAYEVNSKECEKGNKVFMNLEKLYNNKAVYNSLNNILNTMSKQKHFVLVKERPKSEMNFSNLYNLCYDNILCDGQQVTVEFGKYHSICLEGFSDYSTAIGELIVYFLNGEKQSVQLEFPNWIYPECHYDECYQIGSAARNYNNVNYDLNKNVNLYKRRLTINTDYEITMIELPKCNNMHLFSAYLEK